MKRNLITTIVIICLSVGTVFIMQGRSADGDCHTEKGLEEAAGPVARLDDKGGKLTIKVGDTVQYSGKVHASVGIGYWIEYDEDAFVLNCDTKYNNPGAVAAGMCGGDAAVRTCTLRALKKGVYKVNVIHDFRGKTEKVITYTISVGDE